MAYTYPPRELPLVRLWLATLRLGQLNWPRLQRRASRDVARVPRLPTQVGSPAHDATPGFPREFPPRFVRREWLSLDYMPWHRNFIIGQWPRALQPETGRLLLHKCCPPSPAAFWAEALVLRVSGWLCCWSDDLCCCWRLNSLAFMHLATELHMTQHWCS